MQVLSGIALTAALAAALGGAQPADAQPAQTSAPASSAGLLASERAPSGANPDPESLDQPPAPPLLAPLSQDFQAAMANSQLQTYRYNQLTEQALALKKLCDTGFGPADICPKRGGGASDADSVGAASSAELPIVAEISGAGRTLAAILLLSDGRRIRVRPGSVLPNGSLVTAISSDGVHMSRQPGRQDAILAFCEGGAR
jgi:type IV pilus biogenesis protein PilP